MVRRLLARPHLQGVANCHLGFGEGCGSRFTFAEFPQGHTKVQIRRRPLEGHAVTRPFLERGAAGGGVQQPCGATLPFADAQQCDAPVRLEHRPLQRDAFPW